MVFGMFSELPIPFGGILTRTRVERNMGEISTSESDFEKVIRIGHSPDPDDAFMFHALTTSAFPTPGYRYIHESLMCVTSLKLYIEMMFHVYIMCTSIIYLYDYICIYASRLE